MPIGNTNRNDVKWIPNDDDIVVCVCVDWLDMYNVKMGFGGN